MSPKEFLQRLQLEQQRGRVIDQIFDKDYENAHKIVQEAVGEEHVL